MVQPSNHPIYTENEYLHFSKFSTCHFSFTRSTLLSVFANWKKSKENIQLLASSICFAVSCYRGSAQPPVAWQEHCCQAPSLGTTQHQHPVIMAGNWVHEHLGFTSIYSVYTLTGCVPACCLALLRHLVYKSYHGEGSTFRWQEENLLLKITVLFHVKLH